MFKKIKDEIEKRAYTMVKLAENSLQGKSGKEKKQWVVNLITTNLPVAKPFKAILAAVLSKFIDEVIEQAVLYMKENGFK